MNGSWNVVERLPFSLPDFSRHSWVSERARQAWEPRLKRIIRAWTAIEWLSVLAKVREAGLLWLTQEALADVVGRWSASRLSALSLEGSGMSSGPNGASGGEKPTLTAVAVGTLDVITRLRAAWEARDHETVGRLLGYPLCCRRFFQEVWVAQNCTDTTWAMAIHTTRTQAATVLVDSKGSHVGNILWRWLGVRAVPHLPCQFTCSETIAFGERLLHIGEQAGYSEEMRWIREILSWPVEWSALHGIAEVKTPLLKISTRTDATASKYIVRWNGTCYPPEGGVGVRFPYRVPPRAIRVQSKTFPLSLDLARPDHVEETRAYEQGWYYADNGFATLEAMSRLHEPIVSLARKELHGLEGNVLDLGCGNGALLARVCAGSSDLIPYGVDTNPLSLEHARELLPQYTQNFTCGNLFANELWGSSRRYMLTLLMIGRLLEVPRVEADRLLERLSTNSNRVLLYLYPDWASQSLEALTHQLGLCLQQPTGEMVGLLATR